MKYGIITIGYNRLDSMARLLNQLKNCNYYGDNDIVLIISIDNSGSNDLYDYSMDYLWQYGNKIIKTYSERLGLRKHVLKCGSYIKEYGLDAVAVFEDDIFPSIDFYNYMKQTTEFYRNNEQIAGISLYSYHHNLEVDLPFKPVYDNNDVFFLQHASSWGQVWLKDQWQSFSEWYESHDEEFGFHDDIPNNICNWPKTSWLKYHIKYCIEKNKYFVYPFVSLSTCFADIGQHTKYMIYTTQVPIRSTTGIKYKLINLESSNSVYDAFFENIRLAQIIDIPFDDICIDIYGAKMNRQINKYWLTTRNENYAIIKSYGLYMFPQDLNVINNISGEDIKLYDTSIPQQYNKIKFDNIKKYLYFSRIEYMHVEKLKLVIDHIITKVKRFIKK